MRAAKIIDVIGVVWLVLAFCIIFVGYAGVWYFNGLGALLEMLSPFNVLNFIAVVLTILPGIALRAWARHIRSRPG